MADMIEVAQATVTIIPTMQGAQQTITKELTGASEEAGTAAGKAAGTSMATSLSSTMSSAGSALTKGLTVPLTAVGVASVAAWHEVDDGLDTIVQKTGASGEALDDMTEVFENLMATLPTDFSTAGAAVGEINTRFGLTGDALEELSAQFIKFANLNDQDVSSSVDSVSRVLSAFGLDASDASDMLDVLNTVGQQTGVDVGTLSQLLSVNAASFREMGLSAEEAASFLGAADMAGLDSTQMVMGLRTAMKSAASDGLTLEEALAGFTEIMQSNASETDKLAEAYSLFGSRAGASIYNAVSNGTLDLASFTSSLGDFEGSVSQTFEDTLDPLDQFTIIMNQLKSVGSDFVTVIGPTLASVFGTITDVLKGLIAAWDKLPEGMQDFIVKAGLVAAAAGPVLSFGGKAVSGISKLTEGLGGLTGKLGGTASKLGTLGKSASTAASGATAAGSSFAQLGGQALVLVAAGAAVLLIAVGIKTLADSAIALSQEGPEAITVLVELAAVALVMTAGIVAIGSAATVSAAGLLAMGAAVLMISGGISLLVLSLTVFCGQLPTIAEYGGTAALALVELAGGMTLMAAGAAVLALSLPGLLVSLGLVTVETAAFLVEALLLDAELAIMSAALVLISGAMDDIADSARSAADDMQYMVDAVDVVDEFLDTLKDTAGDVLGFVVGLFSDDAKAMDATGTLTMASLTATTTNGLNSIKIAWSQTLANLKTSTAASMSAVLDEIKNGLQATTEAFANTQLAFSSSIALPHFSMAGSFNANTGSVPSVNVEWYRNAATQGARFSSPSVIGVGDASQPELLIGETTLFQKIQEATGAGGDIVIPVYLGGDAIDTLVVKANQRHNYRSGGRA